MATCTIEFPTVKLICSTKHVEHRCPIKFNENCNSGGDTRHDSHPACGWRKEFLRHFYVQKCFQSHRLSTTNWGGGGDFTVGFIKLNHATFPFQISLTKAFVVNVLSLFGSSLFGNKSGEFPGRFPQLVVEIEVVSWWWQKKVEFPIDWIGIIDFVCLWFFQIFVFVRPYVTFKNVSWLLYYLSQLPPQSSLIEKSRNLCHFLPFKVFDQQKSV